ncbi:MAG TPA: (2Fe-2S)-binding protein, partial [Aquabacterium sp.]|nr:(2Fe-2S)-binding protein [Aquabacterium sp.]
GVLLRLADAQAPSGERLAQIERLFGVDAPQVMRYEDTSRQQRRLIRLTEIDGHHSVAAMVLSGDVRAEAWLRPLLQNDQPIDELGAQLLYPSAQAPVQVAAQGKQVCTCFNVTEPQIVSFVSRCAGPDDNRLSRLQTELQCGTNCGSCVPALRKLIRTTPAEAEPITPLS